MVKAFAERIRDIRIEKGLTQQAVADYLQIDRTTYTKYEIGAAEPHLETLWLLAQLFETTTDALLRPE